MPRKTSLSVLARAGTRGTTAVAILAGVLCAVPASASAAGTTFAYTGAEQQYTVPANVTSVSVVAVGAPGGSGATSGGGTGGPGGNGAIVESDLSVTPGQVLYVEVGGPGGSGDSGGAGGFNGGGNGNGGGGGGGASDIRTCSSSSSSCADGSQGSLHSRLVVAAGGGGGGAAFDNANGARGGAAASIDGTAGSGGAASGGAQAGGGGGGATLISGGTGGSWSSCSATGPSQPGAYGAGGASGAGSGQPVGGGGGGGYWGGGGGGGGCYTVGAPPAVATGGGGGGGSSNGGSGAIVGPDTSGVPSVTITPFPAPTLTGPPSSLSFPAELVSSPGVPQSLTVSNSGPGSLTITGLAFAGSDPGDFYVASSTCEHPIATGASCQLTVIFAPSAMGVRSATLVISSNDPAGPASIALSGTGVAASSATGTPGPQGTPGQVELVRCKTVTRVVTKTIHHKRRKVHVKLQRCTAKLVNGPVRFTLFGTDVRVPADHLSRPKADSPRRPARAG
jgi:hypothetical protein